MLVASTAEGIERLGVMAVGDPPGGPDADVTELAHQMRAACRDRVGGVVEVAAMRARLLGQESGATVSELDRAYGGALAVYQNGEFESSYRTLRAIVADLEAMPESEEVYELWVRSMLRLAHAAQTLGDMKAMDAALLKVARTDPTLQADPEQYSPTYRRRLEDAKAKVRQLPRRRLVLTGEGRQGTAFVNGRAVGTTPVTVVVPSGVYRVGGAVGGLRVPTFTVDLENEDRAVVLDFGLAEAVRLNAGPGLALLSAQRGYGIVRAGAWLGLDRLIVVSRVEEGQAQFLLGSMYDVRRGALLREGAVRMVAGGVPSVNLGALAAFLLTGQGSREVKDRTQDGPRDVLPPPTPIASVLPPAPSPGAVAPPAAPTAAAPSPAPATASPPPTTAVVAPLPPASVIPPALVVPPAPSPASGKGSPALARPVPVPPAAAPAPVPAAKAAPPAVAKGRTEPSPAGRPSGAPAPSTAAKPGPAAALPTDAAPGAALAASPTSPPGSPLAIPPPAPGAALGRAAVPMRDAGGAPERRVWMRPAAIGVGVLAVGFTGLAVQQGISASHDRSAANGMVGANGQLVAGADPARYRSLRHDADVANRNMYLSAGAAALLAGTAGYLGWRSFDVQGGGSAGALAFHF
jgi:hypothetical protein